mmetsp:Transcript_42157/g.95174  ORF Transcript_42157/g.95174 Transcript_42157/m.95174 type:complete len:247 (-) Transcript_42157:82-822(-)
MRSSSWTKAPVRSRGNSSDARSWPSRTTMPPLSPPPTTSQSSARANSAAQAPSSVSATICGGRRPARRRRWSETDLAAAAGNCAVLFPSSPIKAGFQEWGAEGGERQSPCPNAATMAPGALAVISTLWSNIAEFPLKPTAASPGSPSWCQSTVRASTAMSTCHASPSNASCSSPTQVPPKISKRLVPPADAPCVNTTNGAERGVIASGGRANSCQVPPASQLTQMSAFICMPLPPAETPQQSTSCS